MALVTGIDICEEDFCPWACILNIGRSALAQGTLPNIHVCSGVDRCEVRFRPWACILNIGRSAMAPGTLPYIHVSSDLPYKQQVEG